MEKFLVAKQSKTVLLVTTPGGRKIARAKGKEITFYEEGLSLSNIVRYNIVAKLKKEFMSN